MCKRYYNWRFHEIEKIENDKWRVVCLDQVFPSRKDARAAINKDIEDWANFTGRWADDLNYGV